MIATTVVDEVRRMLREGQLSQRKIAQTVGVSRGTVNAIASGRRRLSSERRPRHDVNEGFAPPRGRYRRCPSCGGLVQMPCLRCFLLTARSSTAKRLADSRRSRGTIPTAIAG